MKNEHVTSLKQVVPAEVRLKVYKETLSIYKKRSAEEKYGLCLLIPMVLWGLDNYLQVAPDGEDWDLRDTVKAFPEISALVGKVIRTSTTQEATATRIEGLKEIIKNWKQ